MAIVENGINGGFAGKVGAVVGYMWKGKAVMRGLPKGNKGKPSFLQLQQQAKFALLHEFLQPIISLLNLTFGTVAVQMTGYNKAFSYNVKNAIAGTHPGLFLNYSAVLVGRGDLPNVQEPATHSPSPGQLTFSWTDNSGTGSARKTDQAFVAAYCEELKQWKYAVNAAPRTAGSCKLDLTDFSGKAVQTYIGFIAADGNDVTDSLFTGMLNV